MADGNLSKAESNKKYNIRQHHEQNNNGSVFQLST